MNVKNTNLKWLTKEKITGSPNPNFVFDRNNPSSKPEGSLNRPLMELLENDVHLDDEINRISDLLLQDNHNHDKRYFKKEDLLDPSEGDLVHRNAIYDDVVVGRSKAKKVTLFEKPIVVDLYAGKKFLVGGDNTSSPNALYYEVDLSKLNSSDLLLVQVFHHLSEGETGSSIGGIPVSSAGGTALNCFGKYSWQTGKTYQVKSFGFGFAVVGVDDLVVLSRQMTVTIFGFLR